MNKKTAVKNEIEITFGFDKTKNFKISNMENYASLD